MNASATVLVTGATGATGSATVCELLQRGVKVRAMAHKLDERSEKLAISGAEIVLGDLLDFRSVRAAAGRSLFNWRIPRLLRARTPTKTC